jgi:methylphosphotriester-DNA--protein-cysteine methyltransferase
MSYELKLLFEELSRRFQNTPRLSLRTASEEMNISCRTIQKAIKIATGGTFREFQANIILSRIQFLLGSNPALAIKELSFTVGYRSSRSFARSVKRMCGLCPHALRNHFANRDSISIESQRRDREHPSELLIIGK